MSMSKEERERILPVLDMDLVNEPEPGTDAAEVMSFCREHIRRLLADANETDERIAELANELKAKQNKVNQRSGQLKEARQQIADLRRENEHLKSKLGEDA